MEKSAGTHHGAQIRRRVLVRLADAILPPSPRAGRTLEDVTEQALVCLRYMPWSTGVTFVLGMRPLTALATDVVRRHLTRVSRSRWWPVRN